MEESDYPETQPDAQEESSLDTFPEDLVEDFDSGHGAIKIESMTAMVSRMAVGDKIKLALIGNKEARVMCVKAYRAPWDAAFLNTIRI